MLSREQAEQTGDALVAAAEAERERVAERKTHSLVRLYPALKQVPPLGRLAALSDARSFAAGYVSSRLFLALISLTLAALVALGLTGHAQLALASGYLAALLSIGSRVAEVILVRQYLRRSWRQKHRAEEARLTGADAHARILNLHQESRKWMDKTPDEIVNDVAKPDTSQERTREE